MEATKASEAMKVALRSNMYMDSRAIEVASFKSEVIFIALMPADLWGHCPLVGQYLIFAKKLQNILPLMKIK